MTMALKSCEYGPKWLYPMEEGCAARELLTQKLSKFEISLFLQRNVYVAYSLYVCDLGLQFVYNK